MFIEISVLLTAVTANSEGSIDVVRQVMQEQLKGVTTQWVDSNDVQKGVNLASKQFPTKNLFIPYKELSKVDNTHYIVPLMAYLGVYYKYGTVCNLPVENYASTVVTAPVDQVILTYKFDLDQKQTPFKVCLGE
jgi:hypothetical protein